MADNDEVNEAFRKLRRLARLVKRYREKHPDRVRQGYPEEIRALTVGLLKSGHYTASRLHEATGMSCTGMQNWVREKSKTKRAKRRGRRRGGFVPITVTAADVLEPKASPESSSGRYPIQGPYGLYVVGMSVEDIAALWRHLSGRVAA